MAGKRTERMELRLSDSEKAEVQRAADELGVNASEVARRAVRELLNRRIAMRRANADRQRHQQDPSK